MIELAGCRILKDEKLLLLHRLEHKHWELPGGTIEEGDSKEAHSNKIAGAPEIPFLCETAIREASEETGCDVKLKEYLGYIDFEIKDLKLRSHQFSAEIEKGEPRVAEPELFDDIQYVDLNGDKKLAPNIVNKDELIK